MKKPTAYDREVMACRIENLGEVGEFELLDCGTQDKLWAAFVADMEPGDLGKSNAIYDRWIRFLNRELEEHREEIERNFEAQNI